MRHTGTSEQILMILEGANALVPVLGSDRAIRHVHALLADLRHTQPEVDA